MDEVTILFFFRGFFLDFFGVTVIDDCLFMNAFFPLHQFRVMLLMFYSLSHCSPELRSFSHGEFSEQIHEFM